MRAAKKRRLPQRESETPGVGWLADFINKIVHLLFKSGPHVKGSILIFYQVNSIDHRIPLSSTIFTPIRLCTSRDPILYSLEPCT